MRGQPLKLPGIFLAKRDRKINQSLVIILHGTGGDADGRAERVREVLLFGDALRRVSPSSFGQKYPRGEARSDVGGRQPPSDLKIMRARQFFLVCLDKLRAD